MSRAPELELAFTATVELAPRIDVGETPYGRRVSFATAGNAAPFGFTSPSFEVPLGEHDWLNDGAYVGTLDATPEGDQLRAVHITVYKAKGAGDHV